MFSCTKLVRNNLTKIECNDCSCKRHQINKIDISCGCSYDGITFNELFNCCTFVKLTNGAECHNGFEYITGLNTIVENFSSRQCGNGLYFTN